MKFSKVEITGVDTSKLRVLSDKENKELIRRMRSGDKAAREELINGNLRLVLSAIQRFSNRNACPDDMFQVGCIGLIKGIDNFNPDMYDVRLSSYTFAMIIGEIRRYLRDDNPVRVSRSVRDTAYHAMQVKEELINRTKREPTIEEIAKEMKLKKETVVLALEAIVDPISLYEPAYTDSGDTIYVMDQIGDSNTDENWIDEILMRQAIEELSDREKLILDLRFMRGKTQTEVAKEIGISQAQVSRLEKGAVAKIKNH
ncbi:MAG: RNA polymerase sporulation sigma factor SigG [Acutalibacteraceae bacterium]